MTQTIWIARHGNRFDFVYPEWFNTAPRRYDPPLSDDGVIQAQELGQRLQPEKIKHIFASPFLRTVQTAHEIAQYLDLPIKLETGLSEWLNPDWMTETPERAPIEELVEQYPEIDVNYQPCLTPTYPETEAEMMERSGETARRLLANYSEDILLVGHGASVLGSTWGLVEGQPYVSASLCCLVKVVREGERYRLELNGDTSHLSQIESVVRFN
ncbi:histidine phosphatase family protein [Spirulina sp. CS-785/01]|uniref:histidine phosphatase family protein n=1 Tax=Spirulina sp. CS-785/01 TaxID=3021716 RepID=UPI00232C218B|nr:histidine phosphatase family protein [Spirulina sp. CS-785/01]MDB9315322.1 histidine phosphatase family protein [Spirulina sp. CS-785/01]